MTGSRVNGSAVPDQRSLELAGYPSASCTLGNHVNAQFQLDSLGETLALFAAGTAHDAPDQDAWRVADVAAGAIEQRWGEPDAGIWQLDTCTRCCSRRPSTSATRNARRLDGRQSWPVRARTAGR